MAKWTLVLTVGTTAEPLLRAIEETKQAADRESASLSVILVYGRPTQEQQSQENNTLNITKKLIDEAKKLGLAELLSAEIDDPENLDTCLREMKRQLALLQRYPLSTRFRLNAGAIEPTLGTLAGCGEPLCNRAKAAE
jgi:hypothetical protein